MKEQKNEPTYPVPIRILLNSVMITKSVIHLDLTRLLSCLSPLFLFDARLSILKFHFINSFIINFDYKF